MSFFRVLLALLISGGIAYGLYRVVDGQGVERAVEAVRTEIEEPKGETSGTETAAVTESSTLTEKPADTDEGEGTETPGEAEETAAAPTEAEEPAEPSESAAVAPEAEAEVETPDPTDEGENAEKPSDEPSDTMQTAAVAETGGDSVSGSGWAAKVENSVEAGSGVDPTDEGEGAETETAALPAVRLAGTTSGSVDALKIVTGGMKYREALATLTDAGWQPRTETEREGEPNAAEAALLEAGYAELESCKGDERPICRFEFVDGEKRIAAVITAGTGIDPGVIDAFLMDIAAE